MPNEETIKTAEKLAYKLDFDFVEYLKEDEGSSVFVAVSKDLACTGLPAFILVKNGEASLYTGFKYL